MSKNLAEKGNQSAKWVGIQGMAQLVFYAGQLIVITRLLDVETFGIFALALVPIQLFMPWVETGLRQYVVQAKESTDGISNLLIINVLTAFFCFAILAIIAFFYANYYENSHLYPMILLLSSTLFLVASHSIFRGLLERDLQFKALSIVQIFAIFLEFLTVLILAFRGFEIYALIIGYIAKYLILSTGILVIARSYFPKNWQFNFKANQAALRFASYESMNLMLNSWSANIDKLIIGKMLGEHTLGLYNLVRELIVQPVARINPIFTRVAFPIFAKMNAQKENLNATYRRLLNTIMTINTPLLFGLAACSTLFLTLFFGEKWAAASTCLSIMCLVGWYKSWSGSAGVILLAKGRPDIGLWWNLAWSILLGITLFVVLHFAPSLVNAAWAQLLACVLFGWVLHYAVHRIGGINYAPILRDSGRIVLLFFPLGITTFAFLQLPIELEILRF